MRRPGCPERRKKMFSRLIVLHDWGRKASRLLCPGASAQLHLIFAGLDGSYHAAVDEEALSQASTAMVSTA